MLYLPSLLGPCCLQSGDLPFPLMAIFSSSFWGLAILKKLNTETRVFRTKWNSIVSFIFHLAFGNNIKSEGLMSCEEGGWSITRTASDAKKTLTCTCWLHCRESDGPLTIICLFNSCAKTTHSSYRGIQRLSEQMDMTPERLTHRS